MRTLRWFFTILVVLLIIGMSLIQQPTAKAAPSVVFGPPTMGTQVTLGENSIDGPALSGFVMNFPTGHPPGYPKGFPKSALAWTGTDTLHRLNYMTSNDGLHYSNKHILGETSLWRPAVTLMHGGIAGSTSGGTANSLGEVIVLAWTGTDAAHTLNVELIDTSDFHVIRKVTLWGETSFTAPAVTRWLQWGRLYFVLSWAGTDPNQTLNTITFNDAGKVVSKQVLWGWSSRSRPDVQEDTGTTAKTGSSVVLLSWAGPDGRLRDAQSIDTVKWTLLSGTHPIPEWSNYAPSMIHTGTNMPPYWLAWTGMDAAHSLNVMYAENFPIWQDVASKTTFPVSLLAGPELAYVGVTGQVIVAWTAATSSHLLHVAVIYVKN